MKNNDNNMNNIEDENLDKDKNKDTNNDNYKDKEKKYEKDHNKSYGEYNQKRVEDAIKYLKNSDKEKLNRDLKEYISNNINNAQIMFGDLDDEEIEDLTNQMKDLLPKLSDPDFVDAVLNGRIDNISMSIEGFPKMPDSDEFNQYREEMNNEYEDGDREERKAFSFNPFAKKQRSKGRSKKNNLKTIETYAINLNEKVKEGKIDQIIGRDKEINRMIQILNRRTKNNPVLIGEPGVGKTAIAQGLAYKIEKREVPPKLLSKKIYLLDMAAVVAGTQFRGQFEARMKGIVDECKENKEIILVIDEIHSIVGYGDQDNSTNAANILKPSLSNGDIQLIGTTTLDEYRKYIEKDSALERRFQPIIVEEPSIDDAVEIIKGVKKYYEDFHFVKISDNLIEKLVRMSEKYIHNRFLPDKAIDILDEASSSINLKNMKLYRLGNLKKTLAEINAEKKERIELDSTEDYKKAAELKAKECAVVEEIEEIEKNLKPTYITEKDIAEVIERWTKIPVSKITEAENQKLIKLEENIAKRVVGQKEAVSAVSKAIRRNRAGIKSTKRPPSFMFVGPTGVGKTELAKSVAEIMFGSEEKIIRVDMSEYMESHSVSKMIGSPPGYVGYDDAGGLTEKVRRNPYSIVLFDEVEKAHPDILNILLQVLDDGKLTDSQGRVVNFENTIIILTSNIGTTHGANAIGFGNIEKANKDKTQEEVKRHFKPEFLNRLDEVIVFDALTKEELVEILDIMLKGTKEALATKNISVTLTKEAKEFIVKKGTNLVYGARPLRRALQKLVEDELTDLILSGELKDGMDVLIDLKDEKLENKIKKEKEIKIKNTKEDKDKEKDKKKIKKSNKKIIHSKSPENELSFSF